MLNLPGKYTLFSWDRVEQFSEHGSHFVPFNFSPDLVDFVTYSKAMKIVPRGRPVSCSDG